MRPINDDFARSTDDDPLLDENTGMQAPRLRRGARSADSEDREDLKSLLRDIPNFLKLLKRLAVDPRVSAVDKGILAATVAYIVVPLDLIPDFIPFLGQMDDIYLLALALDRLVNRAGIDLLLEHWDGEMSSLERAIAGLDRAGSFLPDRVRSLLGQRMG